MISRMQLPREMYMGGGLTSLQEARNLLERNALPGESLAYVNDEESKYLRYMGGAGIPINSSGIPSYFKVKKIFKPVAKFLDKIVPNELKPFLPFLAAAVPFIGPALAPGLFAGLSAGTMAAISAGANAFSQLSQEGAAERGLNPVSLGLSALSGYGAGAGNLAKGAATSGNIAGNIPTYNIAANPELAQFGNLTTATTPINAAQLSELGQAAKGYSTIPGIDDLTSVGVSSLPPGYTPPTFLQQVQNVPGNVSEFVGDFTRPGMENLKTIANEPIGNITLGQASKAGITLLPGQSFAAGEVAYNAALDAKKKYEEEMQAMGNLASSNKQDQINYIRSAMQKAGFLESEITDAITRSGFMYGGNVEEGFAQGGLMNLRMSGMPAEMDLRKGGFVPLGKKERADDVPARLSKNEFVFTAKAVKNAGGGDVREGAKRMYKIMNQLEARA